MMYKVEAIIREEKLEDIKEALHEIDVNGVTAYQVMGFGAQRGYKTVVRGQEIDVMLLPKIKLEIVVSSEEWKDKKPSRRSKRLLIRVKWAMERFSPMKLPMH